MDFYKLTFNRYGYDSVFIIIDCLNKKRFTLFYKKIIIIKKTVKLYYYYIYCIYKMPTIIIHN